MKELLAGSVWLAAASAALAAGPAHAAAAPRDLPARHWARPAVLAVIDRKIMSAPNGRFNGGANVTRNDLIVALANLGRSLEQGRWQRAPVGPVTPGKQSAGWGSRPVTRYMLASLVVKVARYAAMGLPRPTGRSFGKSDALPPPYEPKGVSASSPVYAPLAYLTRNRMLWPTSPLTKPGLQPVTGRQVVEALAMVVVGANDRLTDEPQNREDLGPPPPHKH